MSTLHFWSRPLHFGIPRNIGEVDAVIRIVAGFVLCFAAAFGHIGLWGWLGLIPLLSGFVGFCPVYAVTGHRTSTTFSELFSRS